MRAEDKARLLKVPGVTGVAEQNGEVVIFYSGEHECDGYSCKGVKHYKTDEVGALPLPQYMQRYVLEQLEQQVPLQRQRFRPLVGGISCAAADSTAGTLGAIVYGAKSEEPFLLSNTHIFGMRNYESILQPSPYDEGTSNDVVAREYAYAPISFSEVNEVDAALAKPYVTLESSILKVGMLRGVDKPHFLQHVRKMGRTSGLTGGRVIGTGGVFSVHYDFANKSAQFKDVIVTTSMGKPGDSGSILVDDNNRAVGLLFGGSKSVTIYIPFIKVAKTLGITVQPYQEMEMMSYDYGD